MSAPAEMRQDKSSAASRPHLTHFQVMQKVRAKMNELYVAFDSFKSDMISDSVDVITEQIQTFSKLVDENKAVSLSTSAEATTDN